MPVLLAVPLQEISTDAKAPVADVAVMVAFPALSVVTIPSLTIATLSSEEVHVIGAV